MLAARLMQMGAMARSMPPCWDGAKLSQPVMSPGFGTIGRMLPGRGLFLIDDLKNLGITRVLPNVYERSLFSFLRDASYEAGERAARAGIRRDGAKVPMWFRDPERGAITTYDGIISSRAGGKAYDRTGSQASVATASNAWSSLFRAGGIPGVGTYTNIPTGAVQDRTNVGAISNLLTNPTNPDKQYLLTFGFRSDQDLKMVLLVDMLVAAGNILATSAVSQTVTSAALTRYTTGEGVMMTFEVTTALGATAANLTVTYTNQAGTGSRSTGAIAMTTSAIAMRLQPAGLGHVMQLQAGDYGVRTVASVVFSISMGAGVIALNLFYPIAWMPGLGAQVFGLKDSTTNIDGIAEIAAASFVLGCLTTYIFTAGATSGVMNWFMQTCQG